MNSPEWAYALVGSLGSMICGSFSAIFSYILSAVLSVYYALGPRYSAAETLTLAPDFIEGGQHDATPSMKLTMHPS